MVYLIFVLCNPISCYRTYITICDFFIAIATKHEGEESYNNMWQKSKSMWQYIAEHYLDEFDYFLAGGDDMFYIMENLYAYLDSDEIKTLTTTSENGVYLGRRFMPPGQKVFNSGGAGYIIDKKALQLLKLNIDTSKCYNHQVGFWEDVNVAHCLLVSSNNQLIPYDTRDNLKRERFHPFTPGQHLTYGVPDLPKDDWYVKYNPELKTGLECCSVSSISFHYVNAELMKQLHAYTYNCPSKKT
jgi:glycoprotein-N-acetylgalactosamine 3-beta-galactosyltransferase